MDYALLSAARPAQSRTPPSAVDTREDIGHRSTYSTLHVLLSLSLSLVTNFVGKYYTDIIHAYLFHPLF